MTFNSFGYVITQSLLSLKRNFWLSAASILTVMISLTILGYSIFFLVNTENIADTFESQVEIAVFLKDDLTDTQIADLKSQIESIEGIATVTLTTKDQAILEFQETMDSDSLLEDLGGVNPFPNKITITTTEAGLVEAVAAEVNGFDGIDKVRYGQGFVEKLVKFTQWLRWIGIGVVVAFACASFLLIVLNIKTNVNSREKEIQIMRLVGASKSFVRWPFLIEGILIGMIGAMLAITLVGVTYTGLLNYIITSLTFLPVVSSQQFILTVLLIMFFGGIAMGFLASAFSVRKFLNI
ncbi:permease-like cell division protein FtsX [Dehalobacter sp. DCM]|uniref:permease-like cell division protein FtsX n=1 Tax=Dehalobacter sp. DCM TaxID=2907827 RepID=UPI0030816CBF|nr:permease-like cell division protein FtsX [Dehalobacter sp. DCM]